jgi:hypothetical protein
MNDYSLSNVDQISISNSKANLSHKLTPRGSLRHGSAQLDGPRKIIIDGNYAYIMSQSSNGIEIVDISNPSAPSHVTSITQTATMLLYTPTGMIKNGNYLYVTNSWNYLVVIDVSVPTNPQFVRQIARTTTTLLGAPRGMDIVGNKLYIASYNDDALEIMDITNPAFPAHVGSYQSTPHLDGITDVKIIGNYAYVSAFLSKKVSVIDISNPATPTYVTSIGAATGSLILDGASNIVYS